MPSTKATSTRVQKSAPARKTAPAARKTAPTAAASSAERPASASRAQEAPERREPGLAGFAAAHAGPLGLLGMGAALLAVEVGRRRGGAAQAVTLGLAHAMRDRLASSSDARAQLARGAAQLGEQAAELSHRGYDRLGAAGRRAVTLGQRHPLASGLLVLAAGAAAAAFLPATRRENRWLGGVRDQLLERAQRSAEDLKGKMREGAEGLRETLSQLADAAQ